MKRHWVRLQMRFEASNAIVSGGLKWQYIAIIATFPSWNFFAIYYGSGVMRQKCVSSAVLIGGRPVCTKILCGQGRAPINHSWHQKIRYTGLPNGEDCIPLHSLILTQYRSVTDRQTDRQTVTLTDGRMDGRICHSIQSGCKSSFAAHYKKFW